uniref:Uncharacterized protein n=1 Tax=Cajanus cajan TaxID=3821 RepID=A0A151TJ84_CAJCA|nr:hypothetical protein KK1_013443 [Cajanus cajan]
MYSFRVDAIPMLDQVMSATKGATDAFSGVSKQVNNSFRMLGTSSIPGIVGYGIGLRHGIGLGMPYLFIFLNSLPNNIMFHLFLSFMTLGSMTQLATKSSSQISQGLVGSQPTKTDSAFDNKALKGDAVVSASDSQTEKAISNFSQNPSLKIEGGGLDQAAGLMQPENKLLQTVMKQRQIIDELVEENEKLYQILQVKDMKIPSTKPQASSSGRIRKRLHVPIIFSVCKEKKLVHSFYFIFYYRMNFMDLSK